ncbi:MAG: glycosyltransferase [Chthoniobacterales bacterium]|nr:glycosyltransferase [Chthoniobacterales bacterium]
MTFKQTTIHWARLRVAFRCFLSSLRLDLTNDVLRPFVPATLRRRTLAGKTASRISGGGSRPIIFASYATDDTTKGSHRFCGGEKLLNNLVLLLRRRGYEAYMVSLGGGHSDWLIEHAPFLSLEEFRAKKMSAPDVRCVTSWMKAKPFIDECSAFYFWDHELSASSRSHFPDLARSVARGKIVRTAGVNRAVQSFHRAVFETPALLLRQLIDEEHWTPDPARRIPKRVGYFDEGEHGADYVRQMREKTVAAGLDLEFVQLAGVEKEILSQMQQCGVFVALNLGKSPFWGEGGPMSPQEAMACGTVPVCFDINGPWELIQQHYNGVIVSEPTPDAMARELVGIYSQPGRLELMSNRALEISRTSHSLQARWPDVARFLDLPLE